MRILVAVDSFKGCLSSADAGRAVVDGVRAVWPDAGVERLVVSDGGEGMLDAFCDALGAEVREVACHDALMRPRVGRIGVRADLAVVEVAEACGLALIEPEQRRPLRATSYGVGELVSAALLMGCRRLVIGLGGSAVSDCGLGMLRALKDARCAFWERPSCEPPKITLASDVSNPLDGPRGAAAVFGPQKGASAADVALLDRRASTFSRMAAARFGFDRSQEPGAGAAGGLGYAFMQFMGARVESGARLLLGLNGFHEKLKGCDGVITGEGHADAQTLMGKLPSEVLRQSGRVPVWLIAGRVAQRERLLSAGFQAVDAVTPDAMPLADALVPVVARRNIAATVARRIARVFGRE